MCVLVLILNPPEHKRVTGPKEGRSKPFMIFKENKCVTYFEAFWPSFLITELL